MDHVPDHVLSPIPYFLQWIKYVATFRLVTEVSMILDYQNQQNATQYSEPL